MGLEPGERREIIPEGPIRDGPELPLKWAEAHLAMESLRAAAVF